MKTLNLDALKAIKAGKGESSTAEGPETAIFQANRIHAVFTDTVTGEVILEASMEARGFKAKENKKTRQTVGGVGWYTGVSGDDNGSYRGFAVNAGLRLSLDGLKVEPGTPIDLRCDADGNDLEPDSE